MSLSLPFKRIADCREMTRSVLIIERSVITSSVRPSAKRSLSCSALTLANGSTAIVASSVDPVDRAPGACAGARLSRTSMISCALAVPENADRDEDRHGAGAQETHPQRLSFHERHGVIGESGRFTGGEHGHDVRVLQSRGDEYLALETLEVDAGGEIG